MLHGAIPDEAVSARGPHRYPIPVPSFSFLKSMISTKQKNPLQEVWSALIPLRRKGEKHPEDFPVEFIRFFRRIISDKETNGYSR
jgi:hypothetical protein